MHVCVCTCHCGVCVMCVCMMCAKSIGSLDKDDSISQATAELQERVHQVPHHTTEIIGSSNDCRISHCHLFIIMKEERNAEKHARVDNKE